MIIIIVFIICPFSYDSCAPLFLATEFSHLFLYKVPEVCQCKHFQSLFMFFIVHCMKCNTIKACYFLLSTCLPVSIMLQRKFHAVPVHLYIPHFMDDFVLAKNLAYCTQNGIKCCFICIPCAQKGGKFYPILLHKFITHRTGKIYLLFPHKVYVQLK